MFEKSFPRTCKIDLKIVNFGGVFITQNGETAKWQYIFSFSKGKNILKYIAVSPFRVLNTPNVLGTFLL